MAHRRRTNAAVYGIDLGKNVFHIAGADADGAIIGNWKLRRDTLLQFFRAAAPALIGMEACPGSQWPARHLQAVGHRVRIIPAQFVKPYVKSNKNDVIDAAAIAEAVTRPTIRRDQVCRSGRAAGTSSNPGSHGRQPNPAGLSDAGDVHRVWRHNPPGHRQVQG